MYMQCLFIYVKLMIIKYFILSCSYLFIMIVFAIVTQELFSEELTSTLTPISSLCSGCSLWVVGS